MTKPTHPGNLSMSDVTILIAAVESLYADEIRPHQNEVLRRIKDRNGSSHLQSHYVKHCGSDPTFLLERVTPKSAAHHDNKAQIIPLGIYFYLRGKDAQWADPRDNNDKYPVEIWQAFLSQVAAVMLTTNQQKRPEGRDLQKYQFKGGRYGMAAELQRSAPLSLQHISLGAYCHLVQLSISYGILSYENSLLQPASACENLAQAYVARSASTTPNSGTESGDDSTPRTKTTSSSEHDPTPLGQKARVAPASTASAEKWCTRLRRLLRDWPQGLVLAQLRKRLQDRYGEAIQPTLFGFTKLQQVLAAEPFASHVDLLEDSEGRLLIGLCRDRRGAAAASKTDTTNCSAATPPFPPLLSSLDVPPSALLPAHADAYMGSAKDTVVTPRKAWLNRISQEWDICDSSSVSFRYWTRHSSLNCWAPPPPFGFPQQVPLGPLQPVKLNKDVLGLGLYRQGSTQPQTHYEKIVGEERFVPSYLLL